MEQNLRRMKIEVFLNGTKLDAHEWKITDANELQLLVYVGDGDMVSLHINGSNYIKFKADGNTNYLNLLDPIL